MSGLSIGCNGPGAILKVYPGPNARKNIMDHKAETAKSRRANLRDERDKKILGDIIYGKYLGNGREPADESVKSFFAHGGVYCGGNHRKVQNVKIYFTVISNSNFP